MFNIKICSVVLVISVAYTYKISESLTIRKTRSIVHNRKVQPKSIRLEDWKKYILKKPEGYDEFVKNEMKKYNDTPEPFEEEIEGSAFRPFSAVDDDERLWKTYRMWVKIDNRFSFYQQKIIKAGLFTVQQFMDGCFHIMAFSDQMYFPPNTDHVYIKHATKGGCWSMIGKRGKQQVIQLADDCKQTYGAAIHETLHALGFYHEHVRPDRDKYIKVNWNKIKSLASSKNYEIPVTKVLVPKYDWDSIMHYPLIATITVLNTSKIPDGVVVGQRVRLSELDYERLKALYPCSKAPED